MIVKKLALFAMDEAITNPNSIYKDMYIALGSITKPMLGWTRVTEWEDCYFPERTSEAINNEQVKILLEKAMKADKEHAELLKQLDKARRT
jgi:hypothetical protein